MRRMSLEPGPTPSAIFLVQTADARAPSADIPSIGTLAAEVVAFQRHRVPHVDERPSTVPDAVWSSWLNVRQITVDRRPSADIATATSPVFTLGPTRQSPMVTTSRFFRRSLLSSPASGTDLHPAPGRRSRECRLRTPRFHALHAPTCSVEIRPASQS